MRLCIQDPETDNEVIQRVLDETPVSRCCACVATQWLATGLRSRCKGSGHADGGVSPISRKNAVTRVWCRGVFRHSRDDAELSNPRETGVLRAKCANV